MSRSLVLARALREACRWGVPRAGSLCALVACLAAGHVRAEEGGPDKAGITHPSIATSLPFNGDPHGARARLASQGLVYDLAYTNDFLANTDGGLRRGLVNQGKLEGSLTADLGKLLGLKGLAFYANGFQIDNTGRMRRDYVGGLDTIAAIEARPSLRLSEIWLEQRFAGGKGSLRIGQVAADTEFYYSDASAMLLHSDWATIPAVNLPSGGAAYPLSTPGARLRYELTPRLTVLLGVLNGDPAGPGPGDEQKRNPNGLNFRVQDPPFVIGEVQLRTNAGARDPGLANTTKLGAWGHFGSFADQRYADDGTLIADPAGSQEAARRRGNAGVYVAIDQQLYRPAGGASDQGILAYTRISATPSDRNPVSLYIDAGLVFAGVWPSRPGDKLGIGLMYSRFSDSARAFDQDTISLTGAPGVVRDYEANLEISYQAQIRPGWRIQPAFGRVWHPAGDADRNATFVGVRNLIHY
ncbi:MAG: carbohydrate porin [Hyphomicrobiaceae bacterium]|nr:carbohydrate porin [Hyphomicrobiaceae bacterium]